MTLRRHRALRLKRHSADRSDLAFSLIITLFFLMSFACGLRWIEGRYGPEDRAPRPDPVRQWRDARSDSLSEAVRTLLGVKTAHAATIDYSKYFGQPELKTVTVEAAPGETKTIELKFKNTGSVTWTAEGRGYASVYTIKPRYHASVFREKTWLSSYQPAKMLTPSVKTGQTGTVRLTIKAPATVGDHSDYFQLASEDTSWIWGAFVTVTVKVRSGTVAAPPSAIQPVPQVPGTAAGTAGPVSGRGSLLIRSATRVVAAANSQVEFTAGFKNTSDWAWSKYGLRLQSGPDIRHLTWVDAQTPIMMADTVQSGALRMVTFAFNAPKTKGDHLARLELIVDDKVVPEALLEIPITVTDDFVQPSASPTSASGPTLVSLGGSEPNIRVGLYYSEVEREEFSADVPFEVRNTDGVLLASLQAGASIQAWYEASSGLYRLTNGVIQIDSSSPLRFVPQSAAGIFTLLSHVDRPAWNTSLNDNRFRGTIELRRHSSGRVWVIDELPMEQYLWGLAETSNNSPTEFMKSLAVAARSYGYWHLTHPGKYDDFTLGALNDQVYKGYGAESRYPRFKEAVDATRGHVVFYAGENVMTPYYTSSDGRTRAWTEVWGGATKPWLVSVTAQYDAAASRPLSGHGVGMSAWDAIGRANAGGTYDQILKYYYSGTELRKLY